MELLKRSFICNTTEATRVSTHEGSASPDMSTTVNATTRTTKTEVATANRVRRASGVLKAVFGSTLDSIVDPSLQCKSQDRFCTGETLEPVPGYRVKRFFRNNWEPFVFG
jgi:hypothetical protein